MPSHTSHLHLCVKREDRQFWFTCTCKFNLSNFFSSLKCRLPELISRYLTKFSPLKLVVNIKWWNKNIEKLIKLNEKCVCLRSRIRLLPFEKEDLAICNKWKVGKFKPFLYRVDTHTHISTRGKALQ